MTTTLLYFLGGLLILIVGADLLVRGASQLAASFGVSPLAIGLTIVAIGTASPEIAVSLQAAANGQGDLMVGNVLGSNIFNILFILGLTAVFAPIVIAEQLIRKDAPIMLGVSLLAFALAFDGILSLFDGLILLAGFVAYTFFVLKQSKFESKDVQEEYAREFAEKETRTQTNTIKNLALIVVGLGLLVIGARWLVDSASTIARLLGVNELTIGLTIVAIGTSLPEVATSIIAALKKESDIAVGNAVGSNIFNLVGVLGLGALVAPDGIQVANGIIQQDFLVMVFVALVTLPIFYLDNRISRLEGTLLLGYYMLYISFVVMKAANHSATSNLQIFIIGFVPLTFLILVGLAIRSSRKHAPSA